MIETAITLPFAPRPWQIPLIEDRALKIVAVVHRRGGKSTAFVWRALRTAATEDRRHIPPAQRNLLNDRPRVVHVLPAQVMWQRTGLWDKVARAAESFPGARVMKSVLRVELPNGGVYQCGGMDRPDAWRGGFADLVIEDEADDVIASGLDMVVVPMLADYRGQRIKIGTPKGNGRLADAYHAALDDSDTSRYLLRYTDTNVFTPEQIEDIRRNLDEEEFEQEMNCFPPGAMVLRSDRAIAIEDVRRGDLVWTHTGRLRPVKETMYRPYTGNIVVLHSYGTRPLRLTPEHPVYTYNPHTQAYTWKAAKGVVLGDWLVTPKKHPGLPIISPALAELIAWFVAEGNVSQNNINFSLGTHETLLIERVVRCLREVGREAVSVTEKTRGATVISCSDVALADLLISLCGSGAARKRLPLQLLAGHERLVLDTLIDGDGCISKLRGQGRHRTAFMYTTISEGLAQQVQLLAATLGLAGTYTVRPGGPAIIEGRTVNTQESYALQLYQASNYDSRDPTAKIRHGRHGVHGRIWLTEFEEYSGFVFNLSVAEDESFLVNGRAVHNCSFTAPNSGSYYGKWIDTAIRDERVCRVTYDPRLPVYTCWDLGMDDYTAIWWFQRSPGGEWRWLEYYEDNGSDLTDYAKIVLGKPYVYGRHFLPEDIKVREMTFKAGRRAFLAGLGVQPIHVVDKANPADRVAAVRSIMARSFFDAKGCEIGLRQLRAYKRQWNEHMGVWRSDAVHDGASHCADAIGTGVQGSRNPDNEKPKAPAYVPRPLPRGPGAWMGR